MPVNFIQSKLLNRFLVAELHKRRIIMFEILKRKKIQNEKSLDMFRFNIGNYIAEEYICQIAYFIARKKPSNLSFISTVEASGKNEECFAGFWYGIKVFSNNEEIMRIPTFDVGDGCFVSEMAATRRKNNLLLGTLLAQYLKASLESMPELKRYKYIIEIKEEIGVSPALFDPDKSGKSTIKIS
jgi:hypothetical protein